MSMTWWQLSSVSLFLLILNTNCGAQTNQWTIATHTFAASPEESRAAAAKIPAEPFMEATVLFERTAYSLDATGRMTYTHSLIYRIESQQGIEGWSEIQRRWSPWYQNSPSFRARVLSVDGKVSTLDQKTITDGPAKEAEVYIRTVGGS